jgi:hypothetical protein
MPLSMFQTKVFRKKVFQKMVFRQKVVMGTRHLRLQRGLEGGEDGRIDSVGFRAAGAGTSTFTA